MNYIKIQSHNKETFTSISNFFIDDYMTYANGDFVKVYLYLVRLMNSERDISVSDIADHFDMTENDICRAIRYWVKQNIIRLDYSENKELVGITLLPLTKLSTNAEEKEDATSILRSTGDGASKKDAEQAKSDVDDFSKDIKASVEKPSMTAPKKKSCSMVAINEKKESDYIFEDIIYTYETVLAKELTQTELQSITYIYDSLHFTQEMMEYLLNYCTSQNKTSWNYMESVAIAWYESGIKDVPSAKEQSMDYQEEYLSVLKALGIRRKVTETDIRFVDTWRSEFGFATDIIMEACKRAASNNPHGATLPYVNGILTKWHEAGVKNMSDIEMQDQQYVADLKKSALTNSRHSTNQFNQFTQSTTKDQLDALERRLNLQLNGK